MLYEVVFKINYRAITKLQKLIRMIKQVNILNLR